MYVSEQQLDLIPTRNTNTFLVNSTLRKKRLLPHVRRIRELKKIEYLSEFDFMYIENEFTV